MTMMACDTEKLTHCEIYTWRCSHSYPRKKISWLLFSLSKGLLHIDLSGRQYCSFFWQNNIIHQGIRPEWWKSPQVFWLNLFLIASTFGYSLCDQIAMSCIFLGFPLGDVCRKQAYNYRRSFPILNWVTSKQEINHTFWKVKSIPI